MTPPAVTAILLFFLALICCSKASAMGLKPQSPVCKMFKFARYFRATTFAKFQWYGQRAQAGDMIELMPGTYKIGSGAMNPENPGQGYSVDVDEDGGRGPTMAVNGTIFKRIGQKNKRIVFCGTPGFTVIDGQGKMLAQSAIRIVQSKFVVVAGFSLEYVLKGLDVQATSYSTFSHIATRQTLQEGIRLRYNSQHNVVEYCKITFTGVLYKGYGEGCYIGTSKKNSVDYGLPPDRSDHNIIRHSKFGPGITGEAIDIKEFTRFGQVLNNKFDGMSLSGVNGARSWVAIKGTYWVINYNIGQGLALRGAAGFRLIAPAPGEGSHNSFVANYCYGLTKGRYCFYVSPGTYENSITCTNYNFPLPKQEFSEAKYGNFNATCGVERRAAIVENVPSVMPNYKVAKLELGTGETARPVWD